MHQAAMETITDQVVTISRAFNGGWRKATLRKNGTACGVMDPFEPGDVVTFRGNWKNHPRYGKQFEVSQALISMPKDESGLIHYLERHFKWIGPMLAKDLVATFGDKLFEVFERSPQQLTRVRGITAARAGEIHEEFMRIRGDLESDKWFATVGISLNLRNKLVDEYGSKVQAIKAIRENPYALASEVWGVGFKKADVIALAMGIKKHAAERIRAGLSWVLEEAAAGAGHCFLPRAVLLKEAAGILECKSVEAEIERAAAEGLIVEEEDSIYHPGLHHAEREVAKKLGKLATAHHSEILNGLTVDEIRTMDADQQKALELALTSKICVITGGPGVGKTYTVNRIMQALGDRDIRLAAPTGKAAKRMAEMTGREAQTIHRLLAFNPMAGGFTLDKDNPLHCDTLIIDETSMIDIRLMMHLLDAVTLKTQVIFVGDVDQLPSVGPGRVLADMIESGIIPTARLQTLHRQAAESLINLNAQRINQGLGMDLTNQGKDFWYVPEENAEEIPELIKRACLAIPQKFGIRANDVQVLCPQKRGAIGTKELNKMLRDVINPGARKLTGTAFCVNDRVIQMKNNYKLEIFNGDMGIVKDADKDHLFIEFEDLQGPRVVSYPLANVDELRLAYALTVHKSQGSEFPAVVIPVHTTNYMMLKRNLLYTGITRGKQLVVLIGSKKAVNLAIRTLDSHKRYSNLKTLLEGA